ncbi:Pr6Pr family membrane protein [Pseudomonas sp. SC11]|uniref:Pr6Pr family membrane protein n=1 Tax=Pseudomonas sp. SC11 TaxID=326927 RepID=UPI00399BE128
MRWPRPWLSVAAWLGWTGLAVQLYLVLWSRWQEQASLIGGLINLFGFFTVLSNTLVATVLSYAAFGRESPARRWFLRPAVSAGVLVSIVLVALAYSLLLRNLWHPQGWQRLADELLHDVMPGVFALYWCLAVPKGHLRLWHLGAWTLYPLLYFLFILWRGHEIGVYPYPFVDVASLGYAQVMLNASGVLAGFWAIGLALLGVDRLWSRRHA